MSTTADQVAPLPESRVIVDHDLACVQCGYNLRTLSPDALCPECATPVARTQEEAARWQGFARPSDLRASAAGFAWSDSVFLFCAAVALMLRRSGFSPELGIGLAVVPGMLTLVFGCGFINYTSPYVEHCPGKSNAQGSLLRESMTLIGFLALFTCAAITFGIAAPLCLGPVVAWRTGVVLRRLGRPDIAKWSLPASFCGALALAVALLALGLLGAGSSVPWEWVTLASLWIGHAMTIGLVAAVARQLRYSGLVPRVPTC